MFFGSLAAVALCFSSTPDPIWRVIAAAGAVGLAWVPGLAVLGGRGPLAIRRFEWTIDDRWLLIRADGVREIGCLSGATVTLGPWLLLAWTVGSRRWHPHSRRYALIGVAGVSPGAFRALKGRLFLSGGHRTVRFPAHPGPETP